MPTVTVAKGDTLWDISRAHGVKVADVMAANGLRGSLIHPGDKLFIPEPAPEPEPIEAPTGADTRIVGYTDPDAIEVDLVSSVPDFAALAPQVEAETPQAPAPPLMDQLARTWPVRAAQAIWSGLTLPGDVYAGNVDPMSDEAIGRTAELASTVGGAGLAGRAASRAAAPVASEVAQAAERRGVRMSPMHREADIEDRLSGTSALRRRPGPDRMTGQPIDERAIGGLGKTPEAVDGAFRSLAQAAKYMQRDPALAATAQRLADVVARNDPALVGRYLLSLAPKDMRALKDRMTPAEWRNTSSAIIDALRGQGFDAAAYSSARPGTREALFGRPSTGTRQRLDDLALLSRSGRPMDSTLISGGVPMTPIPLEEERRPAFGALAPWQ